MVMDDEILPVESYTGVMLYQALAKNVVVCAKSQTIMHMPITAARAARVHSYDPYKGRITLHD